MIPLPQRVTLDSNVWEKIFDPEDRACSALLAAIHVGKVEGFICEAGFRIEAIAKRNRPSYFSQPHMGVTTEIRAAGGGRYDLMTSIGPDDSKHPGLSPVQAQKLRMALVAGVKILEGLTWMGLPRPPELSDRSIFVVQSDAEAAARRERQHYAFSQISGRGVGKGAFDAVNGWEVRARTPAEEKRLTKACAEWADGELVAAHIGYQNHILCTNDQARAAGVSVFDVENRAWLTAEFGLVIMTLDDLSSIFSP